MLELRDLFMPPQVQSMEFQLKNVTEDHPLVPLTLYNKYKGICEPLLFKHTDNNFEGVIFRPATVWICPKTKIRFISKYSYKFRSK